MNFSFYDLVQVRFGESLESLSEYFRQEFGAFVTRSDKQCKYVVEFRALAPAQGPSVGFDASVGNMMYRCGEVYYISDGRNRYAEWIQPQAGNDHVILSIDPQFKPYRAYYYVVLPLLKLLLNRHGLTFIHSSAVDMDDKRYALTGWGGTGKTNTLLRLIESGAVYLSDDLTVVDENGRLFPFPRSINVYHYNLEGVPSLARKMTRRQRARARIASTAGALLTSLLPRYSHFVTIGQKKLSGSSIPGPLVNSDATPVSGKIVTAVVLLYSGDKTTADMRGCLVGADDAAAACLANIMYEFQPIQALFSMYAFLSGLRPVAMVGDTDLAIIRGFLTSTLVTTMVVPPGGSVDPADVISCGSLH